MAGWQEIIKGMGGPGGPRPLASIYSAVQDGILDDLSDGNWSNFDVAMAELKPVDMHADTIVLLIRTTANNRDKIPNWQPFFEAARIELRQRHLEDELDGLVDDTSGETAQRSKPAMNFNSPTMQVIGAVVLAVGFAITMFGGAGLIGPIFMLVGITLFVAVAVVARNWAEVVAFAIFLFIVVRPMLGR